MASLLQSPLTGVVNKGDVVWPASSRLLSAGNSVSSVAAVEIPRIAVTASNRLRPGRFECLLS